jgi:glycerophosphoryl diester phosphodiesterase
MPFSFLARDAGRVHVCGHRGYSLHYPENTLPAFQAAKAAGATTVEIDVMLTRDDQPIVLHDLTVDRTTDGHGFAADLTFEQIRRLDAGAPFGSQFAGTKIPSLREALEWAKREAMGIVLEIKEAERPDLAADKIVEALRETGTMERVIVISFDHVVLKAASDRHKGLKTEAIIHARHADLLGVLKACSASSVSIEMDMFHPDDGRALHEADRSNRVHIPRPETLAEYWRGGRDPLPKLVEWVAEGLIDTISGDDVPFIARLVACAGKAG